MDYAFLIFLSSGLFLGWSLGANDAANIFGTAVGTKMVRFRTAAILASVFVILGAVYSGSGTSKTLEDLGAVNTIAGAFMTALASALTIYWMVKTSIPVSTSQAIVGAIIGWNFFAGHQTNIAVLSKIVSSWFICPLISGFIAVGLYILVKKIIHHSHLHLLHQDCYTRIGLILAGAFGAYALGANNIANVMGVFVPTNQFKSLILPFNFILSSEQVLFLIGSIAIAVGIITYSSRTMQTIGNGIMKMSPLVAWIVVVAQGLVLFLFASPCLKNLLTYYNLPSLPLVPVSSSQAVIGAVMGIGIAKSGHNLNWMLIAKIILGWITTPIAAALVCYISLFFLQNVFALEVCH